jgi:hypothetical protein
MRCLCCNKALNDYESTLRHAVSGDFLDMCRKCLDGLEIPVRGRKDLNPYDTIDVEEIEDDSEY